MRLNEKATCTHLCKFSPRNKPRVREVLILNVKCNCPVSLTRVVVQEPVQDTAYTKNCQCNPKRKVRPAPLPPALIPFISLSHILLDFVNLLLCLPLSLFPVP